MTVATLFNDSDKLGKGFILACLVGLWFSLGFFGLLKHFVFFMICMTLTCALVVLCHDGFTYYRSWGKSWAFYITMIFIAGGNVYLAEPTFDFSKAMFYIPGLFVTALLVALCFLIGITPRYFKYQPEQEDSPILDSVRAESV